MQDLLDRKMAIEDELSALGQHCGSGPLVDKDGFPRADIDVASAAHARSRTTRLQHDLAEVMAAIEGQLGDAFAAKRKFSTRPFARVAAIDRGSVAESMGLIVGDKVVLLDDATCYADLEAKSARPTHLRVLRNFSILELTASAGSEPLGAKLVPI